MLKEVEPNGLISLLYAVGSDPLALWSVDSKTSSVVRVVDTEGFHVVQVLADGDDPSTVALRCPQNASQWLGVRLCVLGMIVKNVGRPFSFEVEAIDDRKVRRRLRCSTFESTANVKPFIVTMPLVLSGVGWNFLQLDIHKILREAFGTTFGCVARLEINGSCLLRRIFLAESLMQEENLPSEFRIHLSPSAKERVAAEASEAVQGEDEEDDRLWFQ